MFCFVWASLSNELENIFDFRKSVLENSILHTVYIPVINDFLTPNFHLKNKR